MALDGIDVVTFDCYGTLIDWDGGTATFLAELALRLGDDAAPNGDALRRQWEAIQFERTQGPYQTYDRILSESLRLWAAERGYGWEPEWGEALTRAMGCWQPFPDTRPALLRAHRHGAKLALITNTDDAIIARTLRHLDLPIDWVITAQSCGAYKPAATNFEQAITRIGVPPERMMHVAFGFKYDIPPAQRAGWGKTAWINRYAEPRPSDERPDYEWRDLWGLAALAGSDIPE